MAKVKFKELTNLDPQIFPENIFERIPEDHPVRLVNMVVDQLDISKIVERYEGGGASSYHPRMMLKVLFYGYLSNVYSCRKIAKAMEENIHFMWISGNSRPDFRTINNFRGKRLKGLIHHIFSEVVKILQESGCVSLQIQYIDGTKIESRANRYTFVWRKNVERNKIKLEAKINSVLRDIDDQIKKDNQEDNKEKVDKGIDTEELKKKLSELNKQISESDKAKRRQIDKLQKEHLPKLQQYEQQLETLGERNSYSKTDPDATFMRLKDDHLQNGQLKPAFNAQISTENQFVTQYSIHHTAGDTTTLISHLQDFYQKYHQQSTIVVADAGYGSEENYEWMKSRDIEAFIKYNCFDQEQKKSRKADPFHPHNLFYNPDLDYYVCPMGQRLEKIDEGTRKTSNGYKSWVTHYKASRCQGCPLRGQCHKSKGDRIIEVNHRLNELRADARERLMSDEGIWHRSRRPVEPEAVFGQLKYNNHFTRFTMVGKDGTDLELGLMLIGHNLRKFVKKRILLPFKSICQRIKKSAITLQDAILIENQKIMEFIPSYNQTH
jgi:transposase